MVELAYSDDPDFPRELDRIRADTPGVTFVSATLGGRTYLAMLPGELGAYDIDVAGRRAGSLAEDFAQQPAFWPALLALAGQISKDAVQARHEGRFDEAANGYGFCLEVALLHRDAQGLDILAGNLFMLERLLEFTGAGAPQANGPPPAGVDATLQRIHQIAADHLPAIEELLSSLSEPPDRARRLQGLAAQHLLLLISGADTGLGVGAHGPDPANRPANAALAAGACFEELSRLAGETRNYSPLLEAIYSALACAGLLQVLQAVIGEDFAGEADGGASLAPVLSQWRAVAPHVRDHASDALLTICSFAVERMNRLRIRTVMAGGAFGHNLSYKVAILTSAIGRDQVSIALALGADESALALWEASRSRALADWMGRSHFIEAVVLRRDFSGSIGEVVPASLDAIRKAAADAEAALLAFFADDTRLHAWLVQPDGTILSESLPRPRGALQTLMAHLPYGADEKDLLRGALDDFFRNTDDASPVDRTLEQLAVQLIPDSIREALAKSRTKRLVIIPDAELDMIPFCCLILNGRYLVEELDISYWPCVSAWGLCKRTIDSHGDSPPLVIGNPDFSALNEEGIVLAPLPGAADEAKLIADRLGAVSIQGAEASKQTLSRLHDGVAPARAGFAVLHLATHGVLDMEQPERSFVALADGVLSVQDLLRNDRGCRSGLTVLSACQSGLGFRHPDSLIGLTNGFFIAGACSVLSSLWKVPDMSTRILMDWFYEALLSSPEARPAEALALAQRRALANPATAHPFRWAAFCFAGADVHPCPRLAGAA